jgi:hypothetical protein
MWRRICLFVPRHGRTTRAYHDDDDDNGDGDDDDGDDDDNDDNDDNDADDDDDDATETIGIPIKQNLLHMVMNQNQINNHRQLHRCPAQ